MQVSDGDSDSREKERVRKCSALAARIGNLELDIQFFCSAAHQRFNQIEAVARRSSNTARRLQTDANASAVSGLLRAARAIGNTLNIRRRIEIAADLVIALRALAGLDSEFRDAVGDIARHNREIAKLDRRILGARREISMIQKKRSRLRCGPMR